MRIRAVAFITCLSLLSSKAFCQRSEFQRELASVLANFAASTEFSITQHYQLVMDSSRSQAFDSSICVTERRGRSTHISFNGVESFSDGEYLVRLSTSSRLIIVSKLHDHIDDPIGAIQQLFQPFTEFHKHISEGGVNHWEIAGGSEGVLNATIEIDSTLSKIQYLKIELEASHPALAQFNSGRKAQKHNVVLKISYDYMPTQATSYHLSDYITVKSDSIQPAERYRDYTFKVLP